MREFRNLLAFASGVLFIIAASLLMFPAKAHAEQTVPVTYWCMMKDHGQLNWDQNSCSQNHGSSDRTAFPSEAAAKSAVTARIANHNWAQYIYCESDNGGWKPDGFAPDAQYIVITRFATSNCGSASSRTWGVGPYTMQEPALSCAEVTDTRNIWWPADSHGLIDLPTACRSHSSGLQTTRCAYQVSGRGCVGDWCFGTAVGTGEQCGAEDGMSEGSGPEPGVEPSPAPVACVVSGGQQHCISKEDTNCGYVNGERWCPDFVDTAGTIVTAQGAVLSTDSGAVVDSEGNPVPPDSVIQTIHGPVFHWNQTTVNNNNLAGGAQGNPSQSGSGIPGAGPSGDGGPGSGTGDGDGDGEPFSGPELSEGDGYGDSLSAYWSDISEGPWGSALDGIGEGASGGSCPVAEFNWIDGTPMSVDFHCALLEDFESLIGLLFFFGWTWIAVRVLFSA